jgi:cytidylate kinase
MIDAVAARTGLTATEVAEREERMPSLTERLVDAMTMGTQELLSPIASANLPPTDERLLEVTRHVIDEAAARGPVVIVGRGAQEMLGVRDDVLSVLCYAPLEALIVRTMGKDGVDRETAAKTVEARNKHRAEWVKAHWGRDWLAVDHYDLCVNTHTVGIEVGAHLVIDLARKRFEV